MRDFYFETPTIKEIKSKVFSDQDFLRKTIETWIQSTEHAESGVLNLWRRVGKDFLNAPASGSSGKHSSFPGGLAVHSLAVVQNLDKFASVMAPGILAEDILLVGLFHDLGKIGLPNKPYYIPRSGAGYSYGNLGMSVPTMSLWWISQFIDLDPDQWQAIMHHDGQYVPEGKWCQFGESRLGLLLHYADYWSTMEEKQWPNG